MQNLPSTRTVEEVDGQAGVTFPDPYRWLEDDNSDEVRTWQREQAAFAADWVRQWPHFDALKDRVKHYMVQRFSSMPSRAGDIWFWSDYADGQTQASVYVGSEAYGDGRCLFDPVAENPEQPPFLSWTAPAPDGKTIAIGVCADGSEANTIRLIDVASGVTLPGPDQVLPDAWMGGVAWLPDTSGFFFQAFTKDVEANERALYFHDMATGEQTVQDIGEVVPYEWVHVGLSKDQQYAIAHVHLMTPKPLAIKKLPDGEWQSFINNISGSLTGYIVGNDYVGITDIDADRGRVVSIPLDSATANDPSTWNTLIPESEATIRTLTPVGDHFYVAEFVNTYSNIRIFDANGNHVGEVPLPEKGALQEMPFPLMNLDARGGAGEFVFAFSSLITSAGIYRHSPGNDTVEALKEPAVRLEGCVIDDYEATSEDGARIPYHVVHQEGVTSGASLLYAYGGFNAPWQPAFPGVMATVVESGGLFVHIHLRGGAEFGRSWWEGGRRKNKQNCYKDLYAVAEDLAARDISSHDRMALTGGSNGGMLCGMAVTQRPDLWAAVVPRVPFLDLIGGLRTPYGYNTCAIEFGDPTDAEEVQRMALFSPYNLVDSDTAYPPVFIDAGDTDPRCPPFHARKFGARLQASAGNAPILLHIWENVGHGWATDEAIAIEEHTEYLSFIMQHTGLDPA